MPVKRPFLRAIAVALALAPGLFAAQEASLTLEQAVETALARNPEVLAAAARVEAARGRTQQLMARPVPGVNASLEGLPIPGLKEAGDEAEIHLGIEQTFEYPGKRPLRTAIGRAGEAIAAAELDRVRLLLAARVKRAYWTAVFAREAAAALERSAERLDALVEDLRAKYGTGAVSYADVLRGRAEKARLRNEILDRAKDKRTAELALAELLGREPGEALDLRTPLPFVPLMAEAAALLGRARETLPAFRLAALKLEQAEAAVRLAGLGRRPDLLAGFILPSVRPNGWGVSFGLTLPFLSPGRARGEAREAAAAAEESRIASLTLDRRVRTAVESAYAAARSAEAQVRVYEESLLRDLEDELGIQLEYFRYGRTEAFSLLDLHRTFFVAQVEHFRALLLYNLALADLEVAGEAAD